MSTQLGRLQPEAFARVVERLERLDRLGDDERQALGELRVSPASHAKGVEFIRQGETPTESTLLVEGFCARFNLLHNGARQITGIHVPGDFVDLHSLLLRPMDHSVVALTRCKLVGVSHEDLRRITETMPHLTRVLWAATLVDGAVLRQQIVSMGRRPGAAQLAHIICELALRLEPVGLGDRTGFDFPLGQAEMADALGLSTVHVNRMTQQLRARRLIEWRRGAIVILDWDGLCREAEFDPTYLNLHHNRL